MGWWGTGIMEGDSPLDFQGEIQDFINGEDGAEPNKEQLEHHQAALVDFIKNHQWVEDREIGLEVLGYLMITKGAKMHVQTKFAILGAISKDISWNGDVEREKELKRFQAVIENYVDKAVDYDSVSLLEIVTEPSLTSSYQKLYTREVVESLLDELWSKCSQSEGIVNIEKFKKEKLGGDNNG